MLVMVPGLTHGFIAMTALLTIALAMALPCEFLHVPGPWIVVSVQEQEPGRLAELLLDFPQR